MEDKRKNVTVQTKKIQEIEISCIFILTNGKTISIINIVTKNGEVAQLARAFGSYPKGRVFESHLRYQVVKPYKY